MKMWTGPQFGHALGAANWTTRVEATWGQIELWSAQKTHRLDGRQVRIDQPAQIPHLEETESQGIEINCASLTPSIELFFLSRPDFSSLVCRNCSHPTGQIWAGWFEAEVLQWTKWCTKLSFRWARPVRKRLLPPPSSWQGAPLRGSLSPTSRSYSSSETNPPESSTSTVASCVRKNQILKLNLIHVLIETPSIKDLGTGTSFAFLRALSVNSWDLKRHSRDDSAHRVWKNANFSK